jgi:hypothetical protein
MATSIGGQAFNGCTSLTSVNIPAAARIETNVFENCTSLGSVTLGVNPPTVGTNIFADIDVNRPVTVRIPSGSLEAYNPGGTFNNADTATNNWGNAFRGKGWDRDTGIYGGFGGNGFIQLTFEGY